MVKKYTQDEINELTRLHELWYYGHEEGKRLFIDMADLSGLDLSVRTLKCSSIKNCNLSNIDFECSNFQLAVIRKCNITNSQFTYSKLDYSSIENCDITGSNMYGCSMAATKFYSIIGKKIFQFCMGKHHGHYVDGNIKIGCEYYPVEYWIKNYREIGNESRYTPEEIEMYGNMIKYISEKFKDDIDKCRHKFIENL